MRTDWRLENKKVLPIHWGTEKNHYKVTKDKFLFIQIKSNLLGKKQFASKPLPKDTTVEIGFDTFYHTYFPPTMFDSQMTSSKLTQINTFPFHFYKP